jgi:hypothetical protein
VSDRVRSSILVSLVAFSTVLSAAGLVLRVVALGEEAPGLPGLPTAAALALGGVALAVLGVLIVRRLPGNVIGWVFVAAGLGLAIGSFAESHVAYSFTPGNDPLPGVNVAGLLIRGTLAVTVWGPILAVLLLFPDGRLVSRRWRPLAWASVGVVGALGVTALVAPGPLIDPLDGLRAVPDNPIGLAALGDVLEVVGGVLWPMSSACLVAAAISVIVRYRRARGVERQQLRWLAWSGSVVVVGTILMTVGAVYDEHRLSPLLGIMATALVVGGLASLPVAVTVAILRYRLYDIDRVISRTVSYGVLTAALVGVYAAGAVGLGGLMRSVTGSGGGDLVVAASTLGVAAAVQPLRHRVQAVVDRRFNRARYDARRTVEEFTFRLRDEVDLDLLAASVREVARSTIQPTRVSIWFAEGRS